MNEKWVTRFTPSARGDLRAIPRETALRILRKFTELEIDPLGGNTTELVGLPGHRRLRVGSYRVIYALERDRIIIWIIAVGLRSRIYR